MLKTRRLRPSVEREYTWVCDLPISTCAFALHGFPAAERRGLRPLVTPRVNPPPLVALSALGAGDLAARFAHPGWGGQAGCCLGSSSGLQGRDAPFPPCKLSVAATEAGTWSRQNLRDRCGSCGASPAILPRALRRFAGSLQKRPNCPWAQAPRGPQGSLPCR